MNDEGVQARPRPLADLRAALTLLTIVPAGGRVGGDTSARATGWYPWIGWLLGAAVVGPLALVSLALGHRPVKSAVLVGALVVAGWAVATRLLHWDGLADCADGLLGGQTRERRLEIMRDSRIGSFGAVAIVLVALIQVGAIADFVSEGVWWPLLLAPVLARLAVSLAAWSLPAARDEGLGAAVVTRAGAYEVAVALAATAALAALVWAGAPPVQLALACAIGVAAALLVPRLLARSVGGMTGDLMGATVLLVETIILIAGAVLV